MLARIVFPKNEFYMILAGFSLPLMGGVLILILIKGSIVRFAHKSLRVGSQLDMKSCRAGVIIKELISKPS